MKSIASLAAAVLLVFSTAASAADYCVAPNTTCGGQNVATFEEALQGAGIWTDSDRIFLGEGTYVAPADGYQYTAAGLRPAEIIGAGVGKTIITSPAGATGPALLLTAAPTRIHDLTFKLPADAPASYVALDTSQVADHIEVTEDSQQTNSRSGVVLHDGGELRSSSVSLAGGISGATGVRNGGGAMTVRDSSIRAQIAIQASKTTTIVRSRLTGNAGIEAFAGTTHVSHTLITGDGASWAGIYVGTQPSADAALEADGVVIYGPAKGTPVGVTASTFLAPAHSVDVTLTNVVVRDAVESFRAYAQGTGHAHIGVTFSDFAPVATLNGAEASFASSDSTNLGDAAGFTDAPAGDFHLRPGSPLIDAGNPSSLGGKADLDGNPLDVDGDGDGIARRDIGVFEWQLPTPEPAPVPVGDAGNPTIPSSEPTPDPTVLAPPHDENAGVAEPVLHDALAPVLSRLSIRAQRLSFRISEAGTVRVTLQKRANGRWRPLVRLSNRATAGFNRIRLRRRALPHGTYLATVEARDAAGNSSAARRIRFRS